MSILSSTVYNINKLEEVRYLFVSSANRNIGTNSRFTIYLPSNLISTNSNVTKNLKIALYNFNMIYEWYNINDTNNQFEYYNGTTTTTISIPVGSYSVYQMRDYLNTVIPVYTVTYSIINNRYTFTSSNPLATILPINCSQFLGLTNGVLKTGTFSSEYPVNMQLYKNLYLNTDLISADNNLDNVNQTKVHTSTILDTIPITCAPYDTINHDSLTPTSLDVAVNNSSLTSISFYLSTDTGDTLENLIYPWTFTLQLLIFKQEPRN